ncbi:hypothetical protein D3C77_547950 [compost metagenome]
MRQRRRQVVEHGIHLAAQQIGHGRAAAAIRHVQDVGAGFHLEEFARQVNGRAAAGRRAGQLAGVGLGVGDVFLHRLDGHLGVDHQNVGNGGDQAYWLEVFDEVVVELAVQRAVDGVGDGAHVQRVAVGRRARHDFRADVAVGARLVLDDEALPELFRQRLGHQARDDVGGATGGVAHHDGDGPVGIGRGRKRCAIDD